MFLNVYLHPHNVIKLCGHYLQRYVNMSDACPRRAWHTHDILEHAEKSRTRFEIQLALICTYVMGVFINHSRPNSQPVQHRSSQADLLCSRLYASDGAASGGLAVFLSL